jgi:hypothetical protein
VGAPLERSQCGSQICPPCDLRAKTPSFYNSPPAYLQYGEEENTILKTSERKTHDDEDWNCCK